MKNFYHLRLGQAITFKGKRMVFQDEGLKRAPPIKPIPLPEGSSNEIDKDIREALKNNPDVAGKVALYYGAKLEAQLHIREAIRKTPDSPSLKQKGEEAIRKLEGIKIDWKTLNEAQIEGKLAEVNAILQEYQEIQAFKERWDINFNVYRDEFSGKYNEAFLTGIGLNKADLDKIFNDARESAHAEVDAAISSQAFVDKTSALMNRSRGSLDSKIAGIFAQCRIDCDSKVIEAVAAKNNFSFAQQAINAEVAALTGKLDKSNRDGKNTTVKEYVATLGKLAIAELHGLDANGRLTSVKIKRTLATFIDEARTLTEFVEVSAPRDTYAVSKALFPKGKHESKAAFANIDKKIERARDRGQYVRDFKVPLNVG